MASSPDWLRRYREGQRDQVWAELRELGGAVRRPGLAEEAQLVCDEMARRARHHVEVIVERLTGGDPLVIELKGSRHRGWSIRVKRSLNQDLLPLFGLPSFLGD